MYAERQRELLARINAHRRAGRSTDEAEMPMTVATATYTDSEPFDAERRLLDRAPTVVGLSGLLPTNGSYATVDVGGASVIVTRDLDGRVCAMFNVCRHRGAEITVGCSEAARLACPYHGWTYHLDGTSAARRRAEYFDGTPTESLTQLPVLEQDGIIWVSGDPDADIPPNPLQGAQVELAPFDLAGFRLFDSTNFTRPINWKLAIDTFCEAYHLSTLHKHTIAPMIHDDFSLFDPTGIHGRMVSTRKSIDDLDPTDDTSSDLLPHATILWFLVPNTVLIHQQDHVQLYQSRPGPTAGEAHLTVSLYTPPNSARPDNYWAKNFELLVDVTDTEDFATAAGIQRGYRTRAQGHVVFGRNEPALQHFHRSLATLLGEGESVGTEGEG